MNGERRLLDVAVFRATTVDVLRLRATVKQMLPKVLKDVRPQDMEVFPPGSRPGGGEGASLGDRFDVSQSGATKKTPLIVVVRDRQGSETAPLGDAHTSPQRRGSLDTEDDTGQMRDAVVDGERSCETSEPSASGSPLRDGSLEAEGHEHGRSEAVTLVEQLAAASSGIPPRASGLPSDDSPGSGNEEEDTGPHDMIISDELADANWETHSCATRELSPSSDPRGEYAERTDAVSMADEPTICEMRSAPECRSLLSDSSTQEGDVNTKRPTTERSPIASPPTSDGGSSNTASSSSLILTPEEIKQFSTNFEDNNAMSIGEDGLEHIDSSVDEILELMNSLMADSTIVCAGSYEYVEPRLRLPYPGQAEINKQVETCYKLIINNRFQRGSINGVINIPVCTESRWLHVNPMLKEGHRILKHVMGLPNVLQVIPWYHRGPSWITEPMPVEAAFSWRLLCHFFLRDNYRFENPNKVGEYLPEDALEITFEIAMRVIEKKLMQLKVSGASFLQGDKRVHLFMGISVLQEFLQNRFFPSSPWSESQELLDKIGNYMCSGKTPNVVVLPMFLGNGWVVPRASPPYSIMQIVFPELTTKQTFEVIRDHEDFSYLLRAPDVCRGIVDVGGVRDWLREYLNPLLHLGNRGITREDKPGWISPMYHCRGLMALKDLNRDDRAKVVARAITNRSSILKSDRDDEAVWSRAIREIFGKNMNHAHALSYFPQGPPLVLTRLCSLVSQPPVQHIGNYLVISLRALRERVTSDLFKVQAARSWQLFGGYFYAIKINAFIVLGYTEITLGELFDGAVMDKEHADLKVSLVQMEVYRSLNKLGYRKCFRRSKVNCRRVALSEWESGGLVVVEDHGLGGGVSSFFALRLARSSETIVILDQRIIGGSLPQGEPTKSDQKPTCRVPELVEKLECIVIQGFVNCPGARLDGCDLHNCFAVTESESDQFHGPMAANPACSPIPVPGVVYPYALPVNEFQPSDRIAARGICVASNGSSTGISSIDVLELLEADMADQNRICCACPVLTDDDLGFPLVGRDTAVIEIIECFGGILCGHGKAATDAPIPIPVCAGMPGIGKSRMLEHGKTILKSDMGLPNVFSVVVDYSLDSFPNSMEVSMSVEASFSWRLLYRFFLQDNCSRSLRQWFASQLPASAKELTFVMAVDIINEKLHCLRELDACCFDASFDRSRPFHLLLGVDQLENHQRVGCQRHTEGSIVQEFLTFFDSQSIMLHSDLVIFPMLATTRLQSLGDATSPPVSSFVAKFLTLQPLSMMQSFAMLAQDQHDPGIWRRQSLYIGLKTLSGIPQWIASFMRWTPASSRRANNYGKSLAPCFRAYVRPYLEALPYCDRLQLAAYAASGVRVWPNDQFNTLWTWAQLQEASICTLHRLEDNSGYQVHVPYALLVNLATQRTREAPRPVKAFISSLDYLYRHIDENDYGECSHQFTSWQTFGAYFYAVKINALVVIGKSKISLGDIFGGALMPDELRAVEVELKPTQVLLACDMDGEELTTFGNVFGETIKIENWYSKGFIVQDMREDNFGERTDAFFSLRIVGSKLHVTVLDRRTSNTDFSKLIPSLPKLLRGRNDRLVRAYVNSVVPDKEFDAPLDRIVVQEGQSVQFHAGFWNHPACLPV